MKGARLKAKGVVLQLPSSFESIGIYTTSHPGRDCRDPDAMDGNPELRKPILRYKATFDRIFHIPGLRPTLVLLSLPE